MTSEDIANVILVVISLAVGAIAVRRPPMGTSRWGIGRRGALRSYVAGWLVGATAIVVIVGLLSLLGVATIGVPGLAVGSAPAALAFTILYLAVLNLVEEIVFRAFLLRGSIAALGESRLAVAAAVVFTGILTSLPYLLGPAVSPLSMIGATLSGLTYGIAYLRSRGVWLSVGIRTSWNVVLGPVFGFTVSASTFSPTLFTPTLDGPGWLTGEAYGPEAGVVTVVVRIALIAALLVIPGPRGAGMPRERRTSVMDEGGVTR